jgi:hypothetical protein
MSRPRPTQSVFCLGGIAAGTSTAAQNKIYLRRVQPHRDRNAPGHDYANYGTGFLIRGNNVAADSPIGLTGRIPVAVVPFPP